MGDSFTLALVGDVALGRGVAQAIAVYGPAWPLGQIAPLLAGRDLSLADLGCAFTLRAEHMGRAQRVDERGAAALQIAGIDAVSLANDQVAGPGPSGLSDTLTALDAAGIGHVGAGGDLAAAATPYRKERNGWRVSVLAYADRPAAWAAGPTTAGIRYLPPDAAGLARARDAIARERRVADLVVVSLHWGSTLRCRAATPRAFAHGLVAAGADVVWGHGANVVQGIEWIRGRPVLYDTGTLVHDATPDADLRNDLAAVFLVHAHREAEGIEIRDVEVLPTRVRAMRAVPAVGADRDALRNRVQEASVALGSAVVVDAAGGLRVRASALAPA